LPLTAPIDRTSLFRLRVGSDRNPGTGRYSLRFEFGRQ
jgi:hypothetical protein